MTVNADTAGKIATAPALDQILSHIIDNNSRLQDILGNGQAFIARALGENAPDSPGLDAPQDQGKLGSVEAALTAQAVLIGEISGVVAKLEKIG